MERVCIPSCLLAVPLRLHTCLSSWSPIFSLSRLASHCLPPHAVGLLSLARRVFSSSVMELCSECPFPLLRSLLPALPAPIPPEPAAIHVIDRRLPSTPSIQCPWHCLAVSCTLVSCLPLWLASAGSPVEACVPHLLTIRVSSAIPGGALDLVSTP